MKINLQKIIELYHKYNQKIKNSIYEYKKSKRKCIITEVKENTWIAFYSEKYYNTTEIKKINECVRALQEGECFSCEDIKITIISNGKYSK